MQLCSLHHCLLFFLILTFTLAPVSAIEICSTRGKLHQPVTLSCTSTCSGSLIWNLYYSRDVVLAQCNQTSCWADKGFSISHDKYLKGDFSLTITKADYSQRNVYACECRDSDYALVRLVIETVFTPVQMKYDEDLKLKVSVPEPVEVIYKSSDSADKVICSVTNGSLQCKDDYRHRTSLTYPELTLRHMTPRDSGIYTIRDTKNNEDIQIYAVAVEEMPGFPTWGIVLITILLCCCVGAGIFLLYKHRMRKQLESRLQEVNKIVQEAFEGRVEIREVEKTLDQLQWQYNGTVYEDQVTVFCSEKREQLLKMRQQLVDQLVQEAKGRKEEKIREAETSLNQLQWQYNGTVYEDHVKVFCRGMRRQLLNGYLLPAVEHVKKHEELKKEDIENLERKLNRLMSLYRDAEHLNDVSLFCMEQRSQISWNRLQNSKEEPFLTKRSELNQKLLHVEDLVQQAKAGTEEEITDAKNAINKVEDQYSYTEYSKQVLMLCNVKRNQLNHLDSDKGLIENKELSSEVNCLIEIVKQFKDLTEQKQIREAEEVISEAEKEISRLELKYSTTEYSGQVSLFYMTKRAELYWYRLLHSDK